MYPSWKAPVCSVFCPATLDQSGCLWRNCRQLQQVFFFLFIFLGSNCRCVNSGRHSVDVAPLALCIRSGKHFVATTTTQAASHRLQPALAGVQLNNTCVSQWLMQWRVDASGARGSLVLLSTHSGSADVTLSACFQVPKRLTCLFIYSFNIYLTEVIHTTLPQEKGNLIHVRAL